MEKINNKKMEKIKIVSLSLGSSKRNKFTNFKFQDFDIYLARVGIDGDYYTLKKLIKNLQDSDIDSIGLGGTDLFLFIEDKKYIIKDSYKLAKLSIKKSIFDGSIIKNIIEKKIIQNLIDQKVINNNQVVLQVSSLDRFSAVKTFIENNFKVLIGDLVFALKTDKIIYNLTELKKIANLLLQDVLNLPFYLLYPIGKKQEEEKDIKIYNIISKYIDKVDIISGDFHYIKKLGDLVKNKIIITNTLTNEDINKLKEFKVKKLITLSIYIDNRSFGANVLESIIGSIINKSQKITINPLHDNFNKLINIFTNYINQSNLINELEIGKIII
ncbi:MAG: quinate 5-dehydrogenase [bacterium]|nr:quinate 5-dehydrogenase [bacterium]